MCVRQFLLALSVACSLDRWRLLSLDSVCSQGAFKDFLWNSMEQGAFTDLLWSSLESRIACGEHAVFVSSRRELEDSGSVFSGGLRVNRGWLLHVFLLMVFRLHVRLLIKGFAGLVVCLSLWLGQQRHARAVAMYGITAMCWPRVARCSYCSTACTSARNTTVRKKSNWPIVDGRLTVNSEWMVDSVCHQPRLE